MGNNAFNILAKMAHSWTQRIIERERIKIDNKDYDKKANGRYVNTFM